jgi:hypothetical protein
MRVSDMVNSDLLRFADDMDRQASEIRDDEERRQDAARLRRASAYLRLAFAELMEFRGRGRTPTST